MDILEKTIEQFDADLTRLFGAKYVNLAIYGSVTLGDFTPHFGDIDFIAVTDDDITESEANTLFDLHDFYRAKNLPNLEYQLEGLYYPSKALADPACNFSGCYIGTSRKGWKRIADFRNNSFDLIQLSRNARWLKGKPQLYEPTKSDVFKDIRTDYENYISSLNDPQLPSHVIVQFVARVMFYLKKNRVGSKSEACTLYYGNRHDDFINACKSIRAPYNMEEISAKYPGHRETAKAALADLKSMLFL